MNRPSELHTLALATYIRTQKRAISSICISDTNWHLKISSYNAKGVNRLSVVEPHERNFRFSFSRQFRAERIKLQRIQMPTPAGINSTYRIAVETSRNIYVR
jgi:hypothetical protein